jgi:8-oxo-dGTP diphosphatase
MKPGKDYIGVGCGALIINDSNQVLLMKRGNKSKNEAGYWSKPGGTVEFGESPEAAVVREIKEELGIDIEVVKFLSYTDHRPADGNQHWISLNFITKIISGEPTNLEPEKCEEIRWFDLHNLPEELTQTTKEPIATFRQIQ